MRPCGKHRFTHDQAKKALEAAKRNGRAERRQYLCPDCRWWHLTSDPVSVERQMQKRPPKERRRR